MATWAEMLSDLRTDLKDTGGTPKWTDAQLYLWAKDAIRDYSQHFPRMVVRTELTVSGSAYPLPSDFVSVVEVECPSDRYLEARLARPGVRYRTVSGQPTRYYLEGSELYLNSTPLDGDEVLLTYYALHSVPDDVDHSEMVMTIPAADEELIRLYVKGKAYEMVRSAQAKLDSFKMAGRRDDNPVEPEVANLMDEYHSKIAERFPGGTIRLWRPGRSR